MDAEKVLKNLKKEYLKVEPPKALVDYGWLALKKEIEEYENKSRFSFVPLFARSLVFSIILFLVLGGVSFGLVFASQKALPGDVLYPIKILSESITSVVSGERVDKLDNRAKDLVEVINKKNDPKILKTAETEYQKEVLKAEKDASVSAQKKEEFQKNLEKQEKRFKETIKKVPSSKEILEDAIDAPKKGRD